MMSMGQQVKYKNQYSTLILQEVLRALSLPCYTGSGPPSPKIQKGLFCLTMNRSPTAQRLGKGPGSELSGLFCNVDWGPEGCHRKRDGRSRDDRTLTSIGSRHLPG